MLKCPFGNVAEVLSNLLIFTLAFYPKFVALYGACFYVPFFSFNYMRTL
jgi:hypothetical protein